MIKSKLREKEHDIDLDMIKMRTDTEAHSKTLSSITHIDDEPTVNDVTIVVNGRQKPPVLNDKVALRNLNRRFLVYGCQNPECLAYNIKHFDISSSRNGGERCFRCKEYLNPDTLLGDSLDTEAYPEIAFSIEGFNSINEPFVVLYVRAECTHCHEVHYIPLRRGKIQYDECECQWRELLKQQIVWNAKQAEIATTAAPIIVEQPPIPTVDITTALPEVLVGRMAKLMFTKNVTRDAIVVQAIENLLDDEGIE